MSHKATNWAVQQRGLKPAVKVLLWHLADRHNVDNGCFPDQNSLARDCEMSRASINRHLDDLEARGLIQRVKRVDQATRRQQSTRYILAFEDDFDPQDIGGHVSNCDTGPCLKNGESRVSKSADPVSHSRETLTSKGTGKGTSSSLRSDGERDQFDDFSMVYPKPLGSDRVKARRAFGKLSEQDQAQCIQAAKGFAGEREAERRKRGESTEQSQRYTPNASRWIEEEGWRAIEPPPDTPALVAIKPSDPVFDLLEKRRGRPFSLGMKGTVTVPQSEIDEARSEERRTA